MTAPICLRSSDLKLTFLELLLSLKLYFLNFILIQYPGAFSVFLVV